MPHFSQTSTSPVIGCWLVWTVLITSLLFVKVNGQSGSGGCNLRADHGVLTAEAPQSRDKKKRATSPELYDLSEK
jgi:hypothetical protein